MNCDVLPVGQDRPEWRGHSCKVDSGLTLLWLGGFEGDGPPRHRAQLPGPPPQWPIYPIPVRPRQLTRLLSHRRAWQHILLEGLPYALTIEGSCREVGGNLKVA